MRNHWKNLNRIPLEAFLTKAGSRDQLEVV